MICPFLSVSRRDLNRCAESTFFTALFREFGNALKLQERLASLQMKGAVTQTPRPTCTKNLLSNSDHTRIIDATQVPGTFFMGSSMSPSLHVYIDRIKRIVQIDGHIHY